MIPVSIASSTAGVLRFLARLSGRRRQRHVRSQSGPGAAASGGGGGGDGSGGDSRPAAAAAAAGQCELVTPVAAAMEGSEERQLYYCCRCRGQRCSCAALGLDELDGEREQQQHRCSEQARTQERTSTTNTTTTTTQHRFRKQQWRTDCGCAADRDVLRRRPPEQKSHAAAAFGFAAATSRSMIPPYLATLLILSYSLVGVADACSSRSTPKPRPPTPTPRPNITFHMYTCQPDYAEWYCLNGATCFTVKIVDSLLYNCLCANGFIGQRCEFKDLDGTYLPTRQRVMLETASIAGAVTIAVFLAVITFISVYIHCKRKQKELRTSSGVDVVDGPGRDPELRPFCSRIFNAKNPNSLVGPSIEHTRMPNWNFPPETSTRMVSVNENKRPGQ